MVSVPDCLEHISAVLQLLGQLENAGPPPASKDAIERLPTIVITKDDVGKLLSNLRTKTIARIELSIAIY